MSELVSGRKLILTFYLSKGNECRVAATNSLPLKFSLLLYIYILLLRYFDFNGPTKPMGFGALSLVLGATLNGPKPRKISAVH